MSRENCKMLKAEGYKITKQRQAILEILAEGPAHLTAEEVYRRVRAKKPTTSFATVYRTLDLLRELNLVNQLDFGDGHRRYEVSQKGNHHHLICTECGAVHEIPAKPFAEIDKEAEENLHFTPVSHRFAIYGVCANCKGA